jgi:hypothetical protein
VIGALLLDPDRALLGARADVATVIVQDVPAAPAVPETAATLNFAGLR